MKAWRSGIVRTLLLSGRSLYIIMILSQWREHRMRVIWQDLLTTARARVFWICWRRYNWHLGVYYSSTVIKFGVNDRVSNGTGSWWIEVMPDTAKLTNVIVTGFGERYNLVREGKMFVKDEAKISSRVGGVKWRVAKASWFLSQMSKNSVVDELKVRRLAVI